MGSSVMKAALSVAAAAVTFLGAKAAFAGGHGVVFIHGTGDQTGAQTCSGSGSSFNCVVPSAVSGYWGQGEIDSIRSGRAYAVVGFHGGSYTPWPNPSPRKGSGTEPGNGDDIVNQIYRFLAGPNGVNGDSDDITDIVMVTHSGGSNQARYILQNYTRSTKYTAVKNATKRVITSAAATLGTYLANQVFTSGSFINTVNSIVTFFGGSGFYNDDGTYFIQTSTMQTYNGAGSYFAGINNPVAGVNFYSTGGTSGTKCYGVTVWGACIGIKGPTLGGSSCDSGLMDAGLLALHTLYLNSNDSATARNNCSDGFISCMSAQRLGNNFNFNQKQDHNQSRRQCNGLDVAIRNYVTSSEAGFENSEYPGEQVPVTQVDSCGFGKYAVIKNSSGATAGYTAGCGKSWLGDGYCDWDCVALYGHDAPATWDASGTHVLSWGATDDCQGSTDVNGNVTSTNLPFSAPYTSTTAFNGQDHSVAGDHNVHYSDPWAGTTSALGYCPQSWVGDGTCDECVMAQYGADGNDCLPGRITQCGGIVTTWDPAYYYVNSSGQYVPNKLYSEGDPTTNGSTWLFWQSMSAVANNGVCENTECTPNNWSPCSSNADCLSGTCAANGYCTISTSQCNSNSDCQSGTCVNGGCTTAGADCSATYNVAATTAACSTNADCSVGTCVNGMCGGCATNADCSVGTCVSGVCTNAVTASLCR